MQRSEMPIFWVNQFSWLQESEKENLMITFKKARYSFFFLFHSHKHISCFVLRNDSIFLGKLLSKSIFFFCFFVFSVGKQNNIHYKPAKLSNVEVVFFGEKTELSQFSFFVKNVVKFQSQVTHFQAVPIFAGKRQTTESGKKLI